MFMYVAWPVFGIVDRCSLKWGSGLDLCNELYNFFLLTGPLFAVDFSYGSEIVYILFFLKH